MKKYTANYTYTNPNFVIQNLVTNQTNANLELLPVLRTIKDDLQGSFPINLSSYLQTELRDIREFTSCEKRFLFATSQTPVWSDTIKGDREQNHYPAKDFFEKIIPKEFGKYPFIQSLLVPEIGINEIVGQENTNFINQQVDFYLPQAKLVIEIDGQQHKMDEVNRISDNIRDSYLSSHGVTTIRITTKELQSGMYGEKVEAILEHLERYDILLSRYKNSCERIEGSLVIEEEIRAKLLPTAIIRFQILLIELLTYNYLNFEEKWNFNVLISNPIERDIIKNISYRDEFYGLVEEVGSNALVLAINDLILWINELWQLKNKRRLQKPKINIEMTSDKTQFQPIRDAINIDFSLIKRYTDENKINKEMIFVRTDYFDITSDRNHLRDSVEPINYNLTDKDVDD